LLEAAAIHAVRERIRLNHALELLAHPIIDAPDDRDRVWTGIGGGIVFFREIAVFDALEQVDDLAQSLAEAPLLSNEDSRCQREHPDGPELLRPDQARSASDHVMHREQVPGDHESRRKSRLLGTEVGLGQV